MNNLVKANFMRAIKDKIVFLLIIFIAGVGVYLMVVPINSVASLPPTHIFEYSYFSFAPVVAAFIAIFTSMFFGTEHSDGVLKNKIVIGHKRSAIYLSNLLTSFCASFTFTLLFLVTGLIGLVPLGGFTLSLNQILLYILVLVVSNFVFCALFVLIAMLCANKTLILLISLAVLMFMVIFTSQIDNALSEPEIHQGMVFVTDGELEYDTTPTENPNYVSGARREIYETILLISPFGQVMKVAWVEITTPSQAFIMMVFSAVNTIIFTLIGLILFKEKDFK